jgi:Na+/H+-translocating membrane pyrophosphatase
MSNTGGAWDNAKKYIEVRGARCVGERMRGAPQCARAVGACARAASHSITPCAP